MIFGRFLLGPWKNVVNEGWECMKPEEQSKLCLTKGK